MQTLMFECKIGLTEMSFLLFKNYFFGQQTKFNTKPAKKYLTLPCRFLKNTVLAIKLMIKQEPSS